MERRINNILFMFITVIIAIVFIVLPIFLLTAHGEENVIYIDNRYELKAKAEMQEIYKQINIDLNASIVKFRASQGLLTTDADRIIREQQRQGVYMSRLDGISFPAKAIIKSGHIKPRPKPFPVDPSPIIIRPKPVNPIK
jgi:hypothetical protein